MLQVYLDDDTTELTDLPIEGLEAGEDSDVLSIHIWNDKGNDAGQELPNVLTVLRTLHPTLPGVWVADGLPPQDQLWCRFKVTGYTNTGDPTWSIPLTDYMPLGAWSGELFGSIPPNCAVHADILMHPPRDAKELSWTWKLDFIHSEYSIAIPPAMSMIDRGVVTGIGDASRSGVLPVYYAGRDLLQIDYLMPLPSGSPNDKFNILPGIQLYKGRLYPYLGEELTISQSDSAAAALTPGTLYWLVVSMAAGVVTVTKGLKGASPAKPTAPAGKMRLGYVRVRYDAGGGAIDASDFDWLDSTYLDRYLPRVGGGGNLRIGPGRSVGGSTLRFSQREQPVVLADDDTSYVWQLASGLFTATLTDEYPETTALPWCVATKASGVVTVLTDRRPTAGYAQVLTLRGAPPASPGSIQKTFVFEESLIVELMFAWVSDNGGGTGGEEKLDVKLNGATIFPSSGFNEWRPHFAYNASAPDLFVTGVLPEDVEIHRGDVLELINVTNPAGGRPAEVMVQFLCRKP